jgi:hypothetical protein
METAMPSHVGYELGSVAAWLVGRRSGGAVGGVETCPETCPWAVPQLHAQRPIPAPERSHNPHKPWPACRCSARRRSPARVLRRSRRPASPPPPCRARPGRRSWLADLPSLTLRACSSGERAGVAFSALRNAPHPATHTPCSPSRHSALCPPSALAGVLPARCSRPPPLLLRPRPAPRPARVGPRRTRLSADIPALHARAAPPSLLAPTTPPHHPSTPLQLARRAASGRSSRSPTRPTWICSSRCAGSRRSHHSPTLTRRPSP